MFPTPIMTPPRLVNPILAILVDAAVVVLIAWAIVSAFPLTWPQALVVSWLFHLLRDTIRFAGRSTDDED
jgi:hypothetical protein